MTGINHRVRPAASAAGRALARAGKGTIKYGTAWPLLKHSPRGIGHAVTGVFGWLVAAPRQFLLRLGCIGIAGAAIAVPTLIVLSLAMTAAAVGFNVRQPFTTVLPLLLAGMAWFWLVLFGLYGRAHRPPAEAPPPEQWTPEQTEIRRMLAAVFPRINAALREDPGALNVGKFVTDWATGVRAVPLAMPYGTTARDLAKHPEAIATALSRATRKAVAADQITVKQGDHPGQATIYVAADSPSKRPAPAWQLEHATTFDVTAPLTIGETMQGDPVALRLFGTDERGRMTGGSMVIGGSTDSGKTSFMRMIVAAAALDPRAIIAVADLKGDNDFATLAPAMDWHRVEDTPENLADLKVMIGQALDHMRAVQNGTADRVPVLVVVDECQEVFGKGKDKELAGMVEQLVRRGRSSGIYVIVATQRPTSDSIPTSLRDNCRDKACLRVGDQTTGAVVLDQLAYAPDTDPTTFGAGAQGMAVTDAPGHRGKVKLTHVTSAMAGKAAKVHPRTPGQLFGAYQDRPQTGSPQDPDRPSQRRTIDPAQILTVWPAGRDRLTVDELAGLLGAGWTGLAVATGLQAAGIPIGRLSVNGRPATPCVALAALPTTTEPAAPAGILDHLLMVWPDDQDRASTGAMLQMLLSIDPRRYAGWEPADVTRELRAHGIKVDGIKIDGRSARGIYRAALVAAKGGVSV